MISLIFPYKPLLIIFVIFLALPVFAQHGIPIVKKYSVENYQAGIENWDAVQDNKGVIYFANSEGVLEFDGVHWRLIQIRASTKVRSLAKSQEGIIYVAGDSEIGYLHEDNNGHKIYISLKENCPADYHHYLSHVWKVIISGGKKYFLAGGAVLVFNEKDEFIKILEEGIYLRSLFLIANRIYAYSNNKGILILDNKTLLFSAFYDDGFILNRSLEFLSAHPEGGIRFHIFDKGFYRLNQGILSFEKKSESKLDTDYIFCEGRADDRLFLGTTSNGLYALSYYDLNIQYHFDKTLGLNDNKIFSIYTDLDNNLWICHENGLTYIELNSPVKLINEKLGINGTGYCAIVYDSLFFVGTSHGLFSSNLLLDGSFYEFTLFKLIRQPVYFLEKRGKTLLIGCLHEIFEYDGTKLKVISKSKGNNKIVSFPGKKDHYLVSTHHGFLLLKYENEFKVIRKIQGIDSEINDFEIDSDGNIWVINTDHKLLMVSVSSGFDSFEIKRNFEEPAYKDLKFLAVSSYHQIVVLGTGKGLYAYDEDDNILKRVDSEEGEDNTTYVVNWVYNYNNEDLWYEKSYCINGKLLYKIHNLTEKNHHRANSLNSVIYGNKAFSFVRLNASELAIGSSDGFLLYNLDFNSHKLEEAKTYIRKILVADAEDTTSQEGLWVGEDNVYQFPLSQEITQIEMDCGANYFYSQDKVRYSFKLDGVDQYWSDWAKDNKIRYTLKGDGEFTFHVRSSSNYNAISDTSSFRFIIRKPWYKSLWWYSAEMGILLAIMSVSIYFNRNGSTKTSKISAFVLVLIILTVFEIFSELLQDWIDAQGVTIFTLKIAINIFIALSISPVESWLRKKLIRTVPGIASEKELWV